MTSYRFPLQSASVECFERLLVDVRDATSAELTAYPEKGRWAVTSRDITMYVAPNHYLDGLKITYRRGNGPVIWWGEARTQDDLLDAITDLAWGFQPATAAT